MSGDGEPSGLYFRYFGHRWPQSRFAVACRWFQQLEFGRIRRSSTLAGRRLPSGRLPFLHGLVGPSGWSVTEESRPVELPLCQDGLGKP